MVAAAGPPPPGGHYNGPDAPLSPELAMLVRSDIQRKIENKTRAHLLEELSDKETLMKTLFHKVLDGGVVFKADIESLYMEVAPAVPWPAVHPAPLGYAKLQDYAAYAHARFNLPAADLYELLLTNPFAKDTQQPPDSPIALLVQALSRYELTSSSATAINDAAALLNKLADERRDQERAAEGMLVPYGESLDSRQAFALAMEAVRARAQADMHRKNEEDALKRLEQTRTHLEQTRTHLEQTRTHLEQTRTRFAQADELLSHDNIVRPVLLGKAPTGHRGVKRLRMAARSRLDGALETPLGKEMATKCTETSIPLTGQFSYTLDLSMDGDTHDPHTLAARQALSSHPDCVVRRAGKTAVGIARAQGLHARYGDAFRLHGVHAAPKHGAHAGNVHLLESAKHHLYSLMAKESHGELHLLAREDAEWVDDTVKKVAGN